MTRYRIRCDGCARQPESLIGLYKPQTQRTRWQGNNASPNTTKSDTFAFSEKKPHEGDSLLFLHDENSTEAESQYYEDGVK